MSETNTSPAVLDVWCELQCPDCRTALDDLRALRARYGDRLELRLRHFPLEKHKHSYAAAQAAEEAAEQGRGWPYAEAVLARAEELGERGERLLTEVADELGLDAEEVDTALVDGRHMLIVDADQAEGKAIGVTGTPTYVIGGELLDGSKGPGGAAGADRGDRGPAPRIGLPRPLPAGRRYSSGLYKWYAVGT